MAHGNVGLAHAAQHPSWPVLDEEPMKPMRCRPTTKQPAAPLQAVDRLPHTRHVYPMATLPQARRTAYLMLPPAHAMGWCWLPMKRDRLAPNKKSPLCAAGF